MLLCDTSMFPGGTGMVAGDLCMCIGLTPKSEEVMFSLYASSAEERNSPKLKQSARVR